MRRMSLKSKRHNKVLEIINQYEIETQEELAEELKRNGFNVTQATVSRDIKILKLVKMQSWQKITLKMFMWLIQDLFQQVLLCWQFMAENLLIAESVRKKLHLCAKKDQKMFKQALLLKS